MSSKSAALLLLLMFIAIGCSSDSDTPSSQNDEQGDGMNDGGNNDDPDPDTVLIPEIAIVGEDIDDPLSLFLLTWENDYNNESVINVAAASGFLNPSVYATSQPPKGSFYVIEPGTATPDAFRFDLVNSTSHSYIFEEYFTPSQAYTNSSEWAGDDYLYVFYLDLDNPLEQTYLHSYNVITGATQEFSLGGVAPLSQYVLISGDYAFVLFQDNDTSEVALHIFNAATGESTMIPFENYHSIFHNSLDNELYLFHTTQGCDRRDYDIVDIATLQITGSSSLQATICNPDFMNKAAFFENKMLYETITAAPSGPIFNPSIYDFGTGNNTIINVGDLFFQLASITNLQVTTFISIDVDLETETIVVGFQYNDNASTKGAVAFLTYDWELKRIVETNNVIPETILFE
ncbi:hypothetical protein POV27_14410 [Aureisphaera galaxeae]|uniref:hypothetical protein n=1 Tax=Aureisphaera galaxeae TaxID=1538023 RepID=UPI00234FF42F|nr:hypothetical protein [Aureisphaera galaxeae]MDC8005251.1 hypothetical protein [Aureisphaera galaxeae]